MLNGVVYSFYLGYYNQDIYYESNVLFKKQISYGFLTFPLPHCFLVQITGIREDRKSRRGVDLDEVIFILAIIVIFF